MWFLWLEGKNPLIVQEDLEVLKDLVGGTVTTPAPVMEDVRSGGRVPPLREIPWDLVFRKVLEEPAMEHQLIVRIVTKLFRVR